MCAPVCSFCARAASLPGGEMTHTCTTATHRRTPAPLHTHCRLVSVQHALAGAWPQPVALGCGLPHPIGFLPSSGRYTTCCTPPFRGSPRYRRAFHIRVFPQFDSVAATRLLLARPLLRRYWELVARAHAAGWSPPARPVSEAVVCVYSPPFRGLLLL